MKRLMVALVLLYMLAGAVFACAAMVICPYDGAYAWGDGYVNCQNGKMACKYKCQRGHWLQEPCD